MSETACPDWVICSCCGHHIPDTPERNRDFHERGQDTGYGRCTECFGEPPPAGAPGKGLLEDDEAVKKRLGWAGRTFYEARFDTICKALKPEQQADWDTKSYGKKVLIVGKFIEKGYMI
jgi:hypothetical protein